LGRLPPTAFSSASSAAPDSNLAYCEMTISEVLVIVSVLVGPHGIDNGKE
jgi:hypothetical protein